MINNELTALIENLKELLEKAEKLQEEEKRILDFEEQMTLDIEEKPRRQKMKGYKRIAMTAVERTILFAWANSTDKDWPKREKPTQKEVARFLGRTDNQLRPELRKKDKKDEGDNDD